MAITRDQFTTVLERFSDHASWAVWGETSGTRPVTGDSLELPVDAPDLLDVLHTEVIIVGLNPGDAHTGSTWKAFHTGTKHNDHVLGEALRGTPAWGGYLRDLLPAVVESRSELVDTTRQAVLDLLAELEQIGVTDRPLIVTLGTKAELAFREVNLELAEPYPHLPLPHYSGSNNGHVARLHRELLGTSELSIGSKYRELVHHLFSAAAPS